MFPFCCKLRKTKTCVLIKIYAVIRTWTGVEMMGMNDVVPFYKIFIILKWYDIYVIWLCVAQCLISCANEIVVYLIPFAYSLQLLMLIFHHWILSNLSYKIYRLHYEIYIIWYSPSIVFANEKIINAFFFHPISLPRDIELHPTMMVNWHSNNTPNRDRRHQSIFGMKIIQRTVVRVTRDEYRRFPPIHHSALHH